MDCSFNPDEVFGTHVDSADNNNWLNIYAEYDLENSQVCDALKVILCREDGFDYEMAYQLNAEEKSAILDKMGQYCRENTGNLCWSLRQRWNRRSQRWKRRRCDRPDNALLARCAPLWGVLPPSWHPYPSTGLKRRVRALCRCADRDSSQP